MPSRRESEENREFRRASVPKIDAFLKRTDTALTVVGQKACDDPNIISRMRRDLTVPRRKVEQILQWMEANPEGIKRKSSGPARNKHYHAQFTPGGVTSGVRVQLDRTDSAELPTPALDRVADKEWIKQEAFRRQIQIVDLLAELVKIGLQHYEAPALHVHDADRHNPKPNPKGDRRYVRSYRM